jgi:hypothetical protein
MSPNVEKLKKQYRKEVLRAMKPKERLYYTFDLAYQAANVGDEMRLLQVLILLRKAINYDEHPLIALDALRLYRHCEALINEKHDFPTVAHIFFELKRALGAAQDLPETPDEMARRDKVRNAKDILYFGKHGVQYGPNPRGTKHERVVRNTGSAK